MEAHRPVADAEPGAMSEDRWLADALANLASSDAVRLGPGDDAAVVDAGQGGVVVTTDALVDGVHFVLATAARTPRRARLLAST